MWGNDCKRAVITSLKTITLAYSSCASQLHAIHIRHLVVWDQYKVVNVQFASVIDMECCWLSLYFQQHFTELDVIGQMQSLHNITSLQRQFII